MAIRMGRWDCPTCGHKGNLGNLTHCVNCASPRSPNVQFYLLDEEEEVKDKHKIAEALAGVDWECEYCGAENKASSTSCKSCGNPRDAKERTRQTKVQYDTRTNPEEPSINQLPKKEEIRKNNLWKWVFVLVLAGLAYYFLMPQKASLEIVKFSWNREIKLENFKWLEEDAWTLPSQAQLISKRKEVYQINKVVIGYQTKTRTVQVQSGTKKVKVGTRDLGNGYFEDVYENQPVYKNKKESYQDPIYKDVPVYETRYRYKIQRWVSVNPLKAEGENQQPYDPKRNFPDPENWRKGDKKELYWVYVKDEKGEIHKLITNYLRWQQLSIGQKMPLKRNRSGLYFDIEDDNEKEHK
jgi:hypothetical protein